ncbi:hypothetical protein M5K25_015990 [Dendrobium thyrsiflorum]|uniref:Glycosyltransferase 61 catalytic domain-containing protein n=1 Tax=Dendrobium thyrsiflorum TaxID=117978 RepID=A0ABD0USI4_DENTH
MPKSIPTVINDCLYKETLHVAPFVIVSPDPVFGDISDIGCDKDDASNDDLVAPCDKSNANSIAVGKKSSSPFFSSDVITGGDVLLSKQGSHHISPFVDATDGIDVSNSMFFNVDSIVNPPDHSDWLIPYNPLVIRDSEEADEDHKLCIMGYEQKLARSFRQAEPQKLTYGLLLVCFIVLLTYLSISKPYDAILSAINLKLSSSSSGSALSDLMNKDTLSNGKENAIVESKTGCSNISSRSVHLCQSNIVVQRNSSSADIRFDRPPPSEGDEAKNIQYFAVKGTKTMSNYSVAAITSTKSELKEKESNVSALDIAKDEPIINPEKWKSMCDYSNRRSDVCELTGDVRIPINQPSVFLVAKSQSNGSHKIRPYARKSDPSAMSNVAQFTLRLSQNHNSPLCTHNHSSPAIVFSVGGYAGNYFHDFSDILLPLFQTSHIFHGKVHFLVSNFRWWWVNKYLTIFQGLSQYEILNFNEADNNNSAIHCFPKAIIGLYSNNDLMLKNGDSMVQFTEFLRRAYLLERNEPIKAEELSLKKPRLLIIARSHTRRFVNLEKIVKMGEKLGFEVLVAEAEANVVRFARVVNTCDVMMGVHGAGLTNLVFLPTNAVFIQIVPWGKLDWISNTYFKEPAISMKLKYLQYDIKEEESTLMEIYGRDDPVFRDPYSIHKLGWEKMKAIYLGKQNVKLNVRRFRGVLIEAMKLLRQR